MTTLLNDDPLIVGAGADKITTDPALSAFAREAITAIRSQGPDGIWNCVAAFRRLLDSAFVQDFICHQLAEAVATPQFMPMATPFDCKEFSIWINCMVPGMVRPPLIAGLVEHRLMSFIAPAPVELEFWEQTIPEPNDVFDTSRTLSARGLRHVESGEIVALRAGVDHCEIRPGRPVLCIEVRTQPLCRLQWYYHRDRLAPAQAIPLDGDSLKREFVLFTCAALGDPELLPAMKCALSDGSHFVRWSAIRSILSVDASEGVAALRAACNDPHPQLRSAAATLYSRLTANQT